MQDLFHLYRLIGFGNRLFSFSMILSPSHVETFFFQQHFYPKVNTTATTVGTIGTLKKLICIFVARFVWPVPANWIWKSYFFIFHDFEPQPFWKNFFPTYFYPKVNTTATTVGTIGDLKNCVIIFFQDLFHHFCTS